ncbi:MAG: hypothetical protein COB24_10970 [Hyphomicrobiales bacterium]|nr:MAG: hypothetical protein COB24_10970 [Hyphomicrobiales bacterium]
MDVKPYMWGFKVNNFKYNIVEPKLVDGETPIKNAPVIGLSNGEQCIPQHYLKYAHNRETVESIICDIEYSDQYPVFVCEDRAGIYLQVGIIGHDNYGNDAYRAQPKIVYGRKWRVEPQLPTSEIIQTAFLALKCAREHEVRELLRFHHDGGSTTPFNTHHDLPLICQNVDLVSHNSHADDEFDLSHIRYDHAKLSLAEIEEISSDKWLIEVWVQPNDKSSLPEIYTRKLHLLIDRLDMNEVYYALMAELLNLSNKHVDENFKYKNAARFSRNNSILSMASLSSTTRRKPHDIAQDFDEDFSEHNYETDKSRVPTLYRGKLGEKINATLGQFDFLTGILPLTENNA